MSNDVEEYAKRNKKPIWGSFSISLLIHGGILFLIGGIVVFKTFERPPVQFTPPPTPPPVARIDPRKVEYKVKMQEQQRRSGRPTVSPRMTANGIGSIALPDIKVDMEAVKERVKATFKTSGMTGSGTGFGSGNGDGMGELGLGTGGIEVSLFNIQERVERVAIIIDVSLSMVEDSKGGTEGFSALKRKITEVINSLNEGVFFNVIMVGNGVNVYQPKLVLANAETKEEGVRFLAGYMNDLKQLGLLVNSNYKPKIELPSIGGSTRHDQALAAAFDFGAETIFFISDGNHLIYKVESFEEKQKRVAEYDRICPPEELEKRRAALEKELEKERLKREKKGLPPKVVERGAGYGSSGPQYSDEEVLNYLNKLCNDLYQAKNKRPPRIHCIAFETTQNEETFMREISKKYHGRFEKISIKNLGVKAIVAP